MLIYKYYILNIMLIMYGGNVVGAHNCYHKNVAINPTKCVVGVGYCSSTCNALQIL